MANYEVSNKVAIVHILNIVSLPQIKNINHHKIQRFFEKLHSVEVLQALEKIKDMNGYMRVILDGLHWKE